MNAVARPRYAQPTATHFLVTFGYAWLAISVCLGTVALMAIIRSALALLDHFQWGELTRDRLLVGVIILILVTSFLLARWVVRTLFRCAPTTRNLVLFLLGLPALLSVLAWSDASRYLGRDRSTITNRVLRAF